jgi:transcription termination factor NusB
MARLDKCILRLAAFEFLFMEDIPPKVSIDEAVEMGKKFGGDDSGSFINGILDNIYNTLLQQGRLKK